MANKIFKGFMQVTAGNFEAQDGYIYFVRNSANTGKTDGYLQFNGKKYGTAAEAKAELEAKIGTLPEGYSNLVDYINGQVSSITEDYATNEALGTLSGRVDTIAEDYLTSNDKTGLEGEIGTLSGRVDTLEAVSAGTRIADLEALSASTRLTGLEASAHTHENKTVLDGITAEKVQEWDDMADGAAVVLSAYTGSDTGLTEGMLKSYEIFQGGVSKGKIDIPKDLVVSSGQIVEVEGVKYLRLTIANSSTPVDIAVTDLVDVYTPGNGIEISNSNEVSAKVVTGNGLTLDSNGIAMGLADGNNAGAMSAADFTKLGTIEASAQTNVIETVKVDGTALTVTNKEVNIELPDYSETYAPIALTGTVADNKTAFDNYTAATDTRLDTIESGYTQNSVYDAYTAATDSRLDVLETSAATKTEVGTLSGRVDTLEASAATKTEVGTLSGRVDTLEAISADTRLDALEAVSADTRLGNLEAVSADTRLQALEALTGDTSSALQSISAADASVSVSAKANNDQTVAVAVSSTANNALSLANDGLFAAIYYDGDDSN